MHELNRLRLAAGIPIDGTIEKTSNKPLTEDVNLGHPITEGGKYRFLLVVGATPDSTLQDVISEIDTRAFFDISKGAKRNEAHTEKWELFPIHKKAEAIALAESRLKAAKASKQQVSESMHSYSDAYTNYEKDRNSPINVVDGPDVPEHPGYTAKDKSTRSTDSVESKDESPDQLQTMDQQDNSDVDKSGNDLSNSFTVPSSIKSALKSEIDQARKESEKLSVYDKDASYFYNDLANAFDDILELLNKETVYDFKKAQNYAQSLMGPMIHKLPSEVWKFLTNGGVQRSLKNYINVVKNNEN